MTLTRWELESHAFLFGVLFFGVLVWVSLLLIPSENRPAYVLDNLKNSNQKVVYYSNENLCPDKGEHLQLIILVTTALSDKLDASYELKEAWRQQVSIYPNITVLFVNATKTFNKNINENEHENINETLGKLSINQKQSAFEFIAKYCSKAKFVVQVDEGRFLNIPHIMNYLKDKENSTELVYLKLKFFNIKNTIFSYRVRNYAGYNILYNIPAPISSLITYAEELNKVFMTGILAEVLKIRNEYLKDLALYESNSCMSKQIQQIASRKRNEKFNIWFDLVDC